MIFFTRMKRSESVFGELRPLFFFFLCHDVMIG